MNITTAVRQQVLSYEPNTLFSTQELLSLGSREALDKTLSRLVGEGVIARLARGIFARPKASKYAGTVLPSVTEVVQAIAEKNNETLEIHGAEAARLLGLTTQMPMQRVYYTSGVSRTLEVLGQKVRFLHTKNSRLLAHAGTKLGLVISALLYLGKDQVDNSTIATIKQQLGPSEYQMLIQADLPVWLKHILSANLEISE